MKKHIVAMAITAFAATTVLAGCSGDSSAGSDKPFGDCKVSDNPTVHKIHPKTAGTLTVAATLPYPAGYKGNTVDSVKGGYMYCLDAEIAKRAGLKKVKLVNTPFEALVTAKSSNFDIAVWDILVTPERKKVVNFAVPYNTYEIGILTKKNSGLTKNSIKTSKIGVLAGSLQQAYVKKHFPEAKVSVFNNNDDMFNALMAGQLDAALNDTATVMPRAQESKGQLEVVGRYPEGGDVAALLPKESENLKAINQIMKDMNSDGTTKKIMDKWLNPIMGGDPAKLEDWSK